jgi:hypothetical protein
MYQIHRAFILKDLKIFTNIKNMSLVTGVLHELKIMVLLGAGGSRL